MSEPKKVKVGVRVGGGPPPGYAWNVLVMDLAFRDAIGILSDYQYAHVAEQVRQLAREDDPTHSQTASVDVVEDFWELREKGGPLGKLNIRVFFWMDKSERAIVVLGVIKKENEGPTQVGDKIRMRRRLRLYNSGG